MVIALFLCLSQRLRGMYGLGFCTEHFTCPGVGTLGIERFETACVDCGVCLVACPYQAVMCVRDTVPRKQVKITVDGTDFAVPERITVKRALELLGSEFSRFPEDDKIFAPCETGGCFACAMTIDEMRRARETLLKAGLTTTLAQTTTGHLAPNNRKTQQSFLPIQSSIFVLVHYVKNLKEEKMWVSRSARSRRRFERV